MSSPENSGFEISRRGYDSSFEDPTATNPAAIVEVFGDDYYLDAYLIRHGLRRMMPMNKDGGLVNIEAIWPKPDSTTRAARTLNDIAAKEQSGDIPPGTYVRATDIIRADAAQIRPRQIDD